MIATECRRETNVSLVSGDTRTSPKDFRDATSRKSAGSFAVSFSRLAIHNRKLCVRKGTSKKERRTKYDRLGNDSVPWPLSIIAKTAKRRQRRLRFVSDDVVYFQIRVTF